MLRFCAAMYMYSASRWYSCQKRAVECSGQGFPIFYSAMPCLMNCLSWQVMHMHILNLWQQASCGILQALCCVQSACGEGIEMQNLTSPPVCALIQVVEENSTGQNLKHHELHEHLLYPWVQVDPNLCGNALNGGVAETVHLVSRAPSNRALKRLRAEPECASNLSLKTQHLCMLYSAL